MRPQARQDGVLVQEVMDELVVYDQQRHLAHSLNRSAAWVWRHCDGETTVAELAELLEKELNLPADEQLVWLALDRLERAHLLQERVVRPVGFAPLSRRQVVRRLAVAGGLSVLLPVVESIVAPTPAMAQTPVVGLRNCSDAPAGHCRTVQACVALGGVPDSRKCPGELVCCDK